jgi:hypothetical protein
MNNRNVVVPARMTCRSGSGARGLNAHRRRALTLTGVLAVALSAVSPGPVRAQERHKVPGLDKITSGGPGQQEFNGKVQSLDLQNAVLNVQSLRENNVEIFPVRKGVRVTSAGGEKLSLDRLEPGANVLVYYEQKGDRRSVKGIIVLSAAPAEPKSGEEKKEAKPGSPS